MFSASWSWLEEDKIENVKITNFPTAFRRSFYNDYHVIKKLHSVISQADIIVAHNLKRFDWPKFYAKVIEHGLPPIDTPMMVDTLLEYRKFGFTSKKLDSLCRKLELSRKMKLESGLWLPATLGSEYAINKIAEYNSHDIPPLKELYLTVRPYMASHPNHNLTSEGKVCPKCGGTNITRQGYRKKGGALYPKFLCRSGPIPEWFQGKHAVKRVDYRP